jgi:N-hydroxyarylamine O-acetyltransferase
MSAHAIDLDAYRRRIGDEGPMSPTLDTLTRLIGRHAASIPFENIEVLARRVPRLDLDSLAQKMVRRRRGGYCFEQNHLFLGCLGQMGFDVQGMEARVRAGVADDVITGRTHMALRVRIDGVDHLADVGFGGLAPLSPIRIESGIEQAAAGSVYRLIDVADGMLLQVQAASGWSDCYCIGPVRPHPIDYELGNWFVATHPKAMLGQNLLMAIASDRGRWTLFNNLLSRRRHETDASEERVLKTRAEYVDAFADVFAVDVDGADVDAVMSALERQAGRSGGAPA